ncbi:subtilisin family serine protease [Actinokineospora baliensis]|uniref:S8 family serine peptidase n=1 Tax=Actinokineospora baliensis TaxID=547056 RepID=UPI00195BF1F7|nr:S8 family serine peptidase [Actinokineospora baliensis]MBM7775689.1 subtilisin family serine protease [Actinokineospora baliensis]
MRLFPRPLHGPRPILALFLLLPLLSPLTPATAAAAPDAVSAKIAADLDATLARGGPTDFFVEFTEVADLSAAERITDWGARGRAVVDALRASADRSQRVARATLDAAKVRYDSFYINNTVLVRGGSRALARTLAGRAEVQRVSAPTSFALPPVTTSPPAARSAAAVEWGVGSIKADQVWSRFGRRGEGIVIGSIDTGVRYDHPALLAGYRGNRDGVVDHNYNWFDASGQCPGTAPCDAYVHGTHTVGTLIGDGGPGNRIGVAPGAKWIAARACDSADCSQTDLSRAGQWMLAPADSTNRFNRPDLRPHIVSNSWSGIPGPWPNLWYQRIVRAWRAAGMFPSFAAGNSGPWCQTTGSPGNYAESFASGAYGQNGHIAGFSSRGSAYGSPVKPNLAAPGVDIRSSVGANGYQLISGTSMATPHTSGAVALLWSVDPSLIGNLTETTRLLNQSAVDVSDLGCGGTPARNNVWGEGRLDALAAVELATAGTHGTVFSGTSVVAGAKIVFWGEDGVEYTVHSGADGGYSIDLPEADHTAQVTAYGYQDLNTMILGPGQWDFALEAAPRHAMTGFVRGGAASVEVLDTPLPPVTTAVDGSFAIPDVPEGSYRLRITPANRCLAPQTVVVFVPMTPEIVLTQRKDAFGYTCALVDRPYQEGTTPVALTGTVGSAKVTLPFDFPFYGTTYRDMWISINGLVSFHPVTADDTNGFRVPLAENPGTALYPFWDDLTADNQTTITTRAITTTTYIVEWRNALITGASNAHVDFEAVLSANGDITFAYRDLSPTNPAELGAAATIGIEAPSPQEDGLAYSANSPALTGKAILFQPPRRP